LKIVSVVFDYGYDNRYSVLSQVLSYSIKKNCPEAQFKLIKIDPPVLKKGHKFKSFCSNTVKLKLWLEELKNTEDDVVFLDCDMLVLKDISSAFNSEFDIGYTKRTKAAMPYNGGVVFIKNNKKAIEFIELWDRINDKMYNDYNFHAPWRDKYAGMNQAAFGYIMEKEKFDAKLKQFPCAEWNACVEDWPSINGTTKIIHVKGGLRRAIFNSRLPEEYRYSRAIIIWNNYAVAANVRRGRIQPTKELTYAESQHPLLKRVKGLRRRACPGLRRRY
jgi:hypothetical protein